MNVILPASVWAIWKTVALQILLGVRSEWTGEFKTHFKYVLRENRDYSLCGGITSKLIPARPDAGSQKPLVLWALAKKM